MVAPRTASAAIATVALLTLLAPAGPADSTQLLEPTLPTPRFYAASVWTGTEVLHLGGRDAAGPLDEILRFDPAANEVQVMGGRLPVTADAISAVWTGSAAYAFGGDGYADGTRIFRYDPGSDAASTVGARLPGPRAYTSAAWDGARAYLVGGISFGEAGPVYHGEVFVYDPGADTLSELDVEMPGRAGTSSVWTGSEILVFGGSGCGAGPVALCDTILRIDPTAHTVTTALTSLPTPRRGTSAVWDGTHAYIFGMDGAADEILRYDPAADALLVMSARLPTARGWTSAAWDGQRAYVVGGNDEHGLVDDIVAYDLAPGAPLDVRAEVQAPGHVLVGWEAPPGNSYGGSIVAYRVYRGPAPDDVAFLAQVGDVRSYVDASPPSPGLAFYGVSAVNGAGEGPLSAPACAVVLGALPVGGAGCPQTPA